MVLQSIMTTQINLRVSEEFLEQAKHYAKTHGFLNIQEFFRETAREKIYDETQVRTEYLDRLNSKEATTFSSEKDSKKFHKELKDSLK